MPAAVSSAARRAKRVIESDSESQDEEMELDDDVEEGDEELDEDDAEGEEDDEPEEEDAEEDAEGEDDAEEEDEIDEDDEEEDTPAPAVKIKLRVDSSKRPARRQAAKKAAKRTKEDAESDLEEFRGDESRATSPSKMTARQRAKREKELGEDEGGADDGLLSLPDGHAKLKPVLTEAERLQKREEMARRRKRQNEQRLQDEQDQTINRLLRAQTGRSRSKLDHTPLPEGESGAGSPAKARPADAPAGVRWVSRLAGEDVVLAVSVQAGHEGWLALPPAPAPARTPQAAAQCAAPGCAEKRKYRSTKRFDVGGCSLAHLKQVEAGL